MTCGLPSRIIFKFIHRLPYFQNWQFFKVLRLHRSILWYYSSLLVLKNATNEKDWTNQLACYKWNMRAARRILRTVCSPVPSAGVRRITVWLIPPIAVLTRIVNRRWGRRAWKIGCRSSSKKWWIERRSVSLSLGNERTGPEKRRRPESDCSLMLWYREIWKVQLRRHRIPPICRLPLKRQLPSQATAIKSGRERSRSLFFGGEKWDADICNTYTRKIVTTVRSGMKLFPAFLSTVRRENPTSQPTFVRFYSTLVWSLKYFFLVKLC